MFHYQHHDNVMYHFKNYGKVMYHYQHHDKIMYHYQHQDKVMYPYQHHEKLYRQLMKQPDKINDFNFDFNIGELLCVLPKAALIKPHLLIRAGAGIFTSWEAALI